MDGPDTDATARTKIGSGVLDKRGSWIGRFEFLIVRPPEMEVTTYEADSGELSVIAGHLYERSRRSRMTVDSRRSRQCFGGIRPPAAARVLQRRKTPERRVYERQRMLAQWPPVDPTDIVSGFPKLRDTIEELYKSGVFPPFDIYVSQQEVTVEMSAAGVRAKDFQVAVTGNTISISGEVRPERGLGHVHYHGIRRGEFRSTFSLPATIDPSTADATYCDGMLRVRMVKAAVTKPHLVPVKHMAGIDMDDESDNGAAEASERREKVAVRSQ